MERKGRRHVGWWCPADGAVADLCQPAHVALGLGLATEE
jgi:hypothetical protein